jgi:hypothetical protein
VTRGELTTESTESTEKGKNELATTSTTGTTKTYEKPLTTEARRHREKQEKKTEIVFDFFCISVVKGSGFCFSLCPLCSLWPILAFLCVSVPLWLMVFAFRRATTATN